MYSVEEYSMINGKQLENLCKVLSLFTGNDESKNHVDMSVNRFVDKDRVMLCVIKEENIFGVESDKAIDVKQILKMKLENSDFEVSIEGDKFVLSDMDKTYTFNLKDKMDVRIPALPSKINAIDIYTDARTLQNAIDKCALVNDFVILKEGNMDAVSSENSISIKLGKTIKNTDEQDVESHYSIGYLKPLAKVMVGGVQLSYATDYPLVAQWCDGAYHYTVYLAPRIESD